MASRVATAGFSRTMPICAKPEATRTNAEDGAATRDLVERGDSDGGEAWVAHVGIGDTQSQLHVLCMASEIRQADVHIAHPALVSHPEAIHASGIAELGGLA